MIDRWTKRTTAAGLLVLCGLLTACPAFKSFRAVDVGKDGWKLQPYANERSGFNITRSIHQSVYVVPKEGTTDILLIKITPPDEPFEIPPFVKHEYSKSEGVQKWYEHRYYRIEGGKTFPDVFRWYMTTFGFERSK